MAFLLSFINVGFFEVLPFSYHMEGDPQHMEAISTVLKTSERIDQTFPVGSTIHTEGLCICHLNLSLFTVLLLPSSFLQFCNLRI